MYIYRFHCIFNCQNHFWKNLNYKKSLLHVFAFRCTMIAMKDSGTCSFIKSQSSPMSLYWIQEQVCYIHVCYKRNSIIYY